MELGDMPRDRVQGAISVSGIAHDTIQLCSSVFNPHSALSIVTLDPGVIPILVSSLGAPEPPQLLPRRVANVLGQRMKNCLPW
jgi:hypothetical protein